MTSQRPISVSSAPHFGIISWTHQFSVQRAEKKAFKELPVKAAKAQIDQFKTTYQAEAQKQIQSGNLYVYAAKTIQNQDDLRKKFRKQLWQRDLPFKAYKLWNDAFWKQRQDLLKVAEEGSWFLNKDQARALLKTLQELPFRVSYELTKPILEAFHGKEHMFMVGAMRGHSPHKVTAWLNHHERLLQKTLKKPRAPRANTKAATPPAK